jgi:hypothetical protein
VYYLAHRKIKRQPSVESWRADAKTGLFTDFGQRLEARRANVNLARLALNVEGVLLDIRLEHPIGRALGMAHVMPKIGAFAANFTLGHCYSPSFDFIRAAR